MYIGVVGSCIIKIEDFSRFHIINHLSLHLLLSLHSSSQVKATRLISSSSIWVIAFGATYHMTGNSNLFTTFQSYPSTFIVTLANGSTSFVLRLGTIHATPQITLSSILSLPQLSFNLISVSKLTRTFNYSILFFSRLLFDSGSFDEADYW